MGSASFAHIEAKRDRHVEGKLSFEYYSKGLMWALVLQVKAFEVLPNWKMQQHLPEAGEIMENRLQ